MVFTFGYLPFSPNSCRDQSFNAYVTFSFFYSLSTAVYQLWICESYVRDSIESTTLHLESSIEHCIKVRLFKIIQQLYILFKSVWKKLYCKVMWFLFATNNLHNAIDYIYKHVCSCKINHKVQLSDVHWKSLVAAVTARTSKRALATHVT